MSRFAVIAGTGFLFCLTSLLPAAQEKPSVLLITVDTLRADRLESYGYDGGKTPTSSGLAREGILFENVLVQTPITLPSHATILTGTYPFYHGVQDVVGRLRSDIPTLAEWFKQRGYKTGAVVGSTVLLEQWGLARGFDFYEDSFPTQGIRQIDFSRVERPANKVVDIASQWISHNSREPFFLWVHVYDPHDPYVPPKPFQAEFKEQPYDGEVAFVESELERLMEHLKQQRVYDKTLIVYTSDHGESLGEHKERYHAYYLYDASLRIPLIFRLPMGISKGRYKPGTRVANQVRSVDIAPTIVQLLGEPVPEWMQGEGLAGMMVGKRSIRDLPAYAETHYPRIHFGWSSLFSYSTPTHKFIEAPIPELYDLGNDPGELSNVFKDQTALANRLKTEMHELQLKYASRSNLLLDAEPEGSADMETIERLKSLGYVAFSSGVGADSDEVLPDPKEKIDIYNRLNEAIDLSRKGESKAAVRIIQEVAEIEPKMPIVHFLLATEYFREGLFLKAAEQFQETIRYNPGSNVARLNLARCYLQSGLTSKAEDTLEELLESEPANSGARHLLATVLAKRKDYQGAVEQQKIVLEVRPNYVEGLNNLGSYYLNLGNDLQAAIAYERALQRAPDSVMIRTNLSLAYLRQRRFDDAIGQAEAAIELAPRAALAHYYAGQAYMGKGMRGEARSCFEKAKQLNPSLNIPGL
jgi:arylsulfatase A-like enzyme/Tfp pilus assembly protein PilF